MVLSDHEIWMEIGSGRLAFNPQLTFDQVSPSSIDLHLGDTFTRFSQSTMAGVSTSIDLSQLDDVEQFASIHGKEVTLSAGEKLTLAPDEFALAYTKEHLTIPNYLAGRIEGRSSFARLGISIHQTAPTVHATFRGYLRLEIRNNGVYECKFTPGLRICQLILERLGSPSVTELMSKFQDAR